MGIEPGECCDMEDMEEDDADGDNMDDGSGKAANAIMISMKIANRKKMMNQED